MSTDDIKNGIKKRFQEEAKACKSTEEKRDLALKLWKEYEPYKTSLADRKLEEYIMDKRVYLEENRLNLQTNRKLSGIPKLVLKEEYSKIMILACVISGILIGGFYRNYCMSEMWFCMPALIFIIEELRVRRFNIPKEYQGVIDVKKEIATMNKTDILANEDVYFKNGNPKAKKYREEVTRQYQEYVVKRMKNPYRTSGNKIPLLSGRFRESGGVYVWWHNDEVVYVGLSNNFNNRMRQHHKAFFSYEATEKKYNYGIDPEDIYVQIIAETDDVIEQRVLESYYYHKYNRPKLNSVEPTKFEKILSEVRYRKVWDEISSRVA